MAAERSSPAEAVRFLKQQGMVLESAHGRLPSLVEWIARERISGSWWSHPRSHEIFAVLRAVRGSPDVLVCRLVDNKITLVHRRLWPALVRLADSLDPKRLAAVAEIHTPQGKHVVQATPFLDWVSPDVLDEAKALTRADAARALGLDGVQS
jgi:hypothetical protein